MEFISLLGLWKDDEVGSGWKAWDMFLTPSWSNSVRVTVCLKGHCKRASYSPFMMVTNKDRWVLLPQPSPFMYSLSQICLVLPASVVGNRVQGNSLAYLGLVSATLNLWYLPYEATIITYSLLPWEPTQRILPVSSEWHSLLYPQQWLPAASPIFLGQISPADDCSDGISTSVLDICRSLCSEE